MDKMEEDLIEDGIVTEDEIMVRTIQTAGITGGIMIIISGVQTLTGTIIINNNKIGDRPMINGIDLHQGQTMTNIKRCYVFMAVDIW